MGKNNNQNNVLKSYKKFKNKLIPPIMQLSNIELTSFRDNTLPCLIWVSALFLRNKDRKAVETLIEFIIKCHEIINDESLPPLVFLNNFSTLSETQKEIILKKLNDENILNSLQENLVHQYHLLKNYPLSFLFKDYIYGIDREDAIEMLKEDVSALLDRRSLHSTKVQTTAFISMTATKKILLSSKIDFPDFNSIFTAPESDESKRVASFVRASLNTPVSYRNTEGSKNNWAESFWQQSFDIERCA